jgi:hypothetical protein
MKDDAYKRTNKAYRLALMGNKMLREKKYILYFKIETKLYFLPTIIFLKYISKKITKK